MVIGDVPTGDDISAAGVSARAEYERRAKRHQDRLVGFGPWLLAGAVAGAVAGVVVAFVLREPRAGMMVLVLVLAVDVRVVLPPDSTGSWATGAKGEVLTARALEQLKIEGFVILHDRRIPGSSANIDHIVIGPPGVAVVETKSFGGKVRVKGGEVYVGGYRKTSQTVDEAKREALAVTVALADELERRGLKVRPILCVHRADLPFFTASPQGVSIVDGRGLVKTFRKAQRQLAPEDVRALAQLANDRLRPASAPVPRLYDSLAAPPNESRPGSPAALSPGPTEGDEPFQLPIRREQLRLAREARARATGKRTYRTPRGLADGEAPPAIPPPEGDE
jgi:hypothetical protein